MFLHWRGKSSLKTPPQSSMMTPTQSSLKTPTQLVWRPHAISLIPPTPQSILKTSRNQFDAPPPPRTPHHNPVWRPHTISLMTPTQSTLKTPRNQFDDPNTISLKTPLNPVSIPHTIQFEDPDQSSLKTPHNPVWRPHTIVRQTRRTLYFWRKIISTNSLQKQVVSVYELSNERLR